MSRTNNQKLPWLAVVERVREMCKDERFRMSTLPGLPQWREFCVVWTTAALGMRDQAIHIMCDNPNQNHDSLMVWCWEVVDELVDAVLLIVDERSVLSQNDIVTHFQVLRGAGLIYPDGTLHRLVREKMEREQMQVDSAESARVLRSNLEANENQGKLDTLIAARKAQQQGKKP